MNEKYVHLGSHVTDVIICHVDQPESETWSNQSPTRGQTRVRHVDKPECDTWTIQSSTRGQTATRHVALCQSHIIISMSARALPREQPAWAVPRGIPFRDQFRDHLAWS
jgi:hypothetical protein